MCMTHQLLNQFDLKDDVDRARFEAAWADFGAYLIEADYAVEVGPLFARQPDSGYDTDAERSQTLMSVITFRDQSQADRAWAAIETRVQPLGKLHAGVFGKVRDAVFTFWRTG